MSKRAIIFLAVVFLPVLAGCGRIEDKAELTAPAGQNQPSAQGEQAVSGSSSTNNQAATLSNQATTMTTQPASESKIEKTKTYTAIMHTDAGDITLSLNAAETPITVNNFVTLAQKGFYDGTIFHRVIKGFMIQGGDPKGDGTGGPGYQFDDEKFSGSYDRGVIAMANAGPNTNGSQFFIMHQAYPLPKNYVIFGKVIKGIETVDKIAEAPVELSAAGEMSKPVTPVKVKTIEISAK